MTDDIALPDLPPPWQPDLFRAIRNYFASGDHKLRKM